MLGFIITLIIVVIAGFIARLSFPASDPMSVVATIVLGIVGSFVGGFLGYLLFHKDARGCLQPSGHHRLDHRRHHRAADLPARATAPPRVPRLAPAARELPGGGSPASPSGARASDARHVSPASRAAAITNHPLARHTIRRRRGP